MTEKRKLIVFFIGIFLAHLCIYGNLIISDPILGYDDHSLIKPLEKMNFPWGYQLLIDVQPIRDFSFFFDIGIKHHLGISTFHLTNIIIWFVITILFFHLLKALKVPLKHRLLVTLLFSFHPVFVNSVAWISARKHLLSTMFIFAGTLFLLEMAKIKMRFFLKSIMTGLIYGCAIFSNPMPILWPFWGMLWLNFYSQQRKRSIIIFFLPCLLIFVIGIYLNYSYYIPSNLPQGIAPSKMLGLNAPTLMMIPQAFGRYFFNFLFPINLSIIYRIFSFPNLLGSILFTIWLFLIIRIVNFKTSFLWLTFLFLNLALVTFNMTHIFVSDTYVLYSSLAYFYLSYLLLKYFWERWSSITKLRSFTLRMTIVVIVLFYIVRSSYETINWSDTFLIYQNAYQEEPCEKSANLHLYSLLHEKETIFDLNKEQVLGMLNISANSDFTTTFLVRIFEHPKMVNEEKISFISRVEVNHPLKFYFLTELFLKKKDKSMSCKNLQNYLDQEKMLNSHLVKNERLIELKKFCGFDY